MAEQRRILMAVTGAGGTRLAGGVLKRLVADDRVSHVDLLVSSNGRRLLSFEQGVAHDADPVEVLLGGASDKVSSWDPEADFAGPPSSGSTKYWGMIILPCAMGAAARIALGVANTLIERAADVCLKERRPLILCIRETPLNLIHLRNLVQAAEAGAVVYPMVPTYYNVPQDLKQMDHEFVMRLLGFIGLDQTDAYEWNDPETGSAAHEEHVNQAKST